MDDNIFAWVIWKLCGMLAVWMLVAIVVNIVDNHERRTITQAKDA